MRRPNPGWKVSAKLRRVNWLINANRVPDELRQLAAIAKASFNPNQPRVPAGNPDGGQWTDGGGGDGDGAAARQRVSEASTVAERLQEFGSARRISTDLQDQCWAQHMRDIFQCRMVGLRACYEQAALRYANCLVGLPI